MKLALAVVVASGGVAHADDQPSRSRGERGPAVYVGGLGHLEVGPELDEYGDPEVQTYGAVRMTIGWEPAATPYPQYRGVRFAGAITPEIIGGALMESDRSEILIGAGVRAELRIVQREGGLLRIDSRSTMYLAARGMAVGRDRDLQFEGVIGNHFSIGESPVRAGFELGITKRHTDGMDERGGALVQIFLGYGPR